MTSLRKLFLVVWTGLIGTALWPCTGASANPENRPRIVILGDSITAGYGLDRTQAYPALLQQKADAASLKYEIVNAGISGDTTASGLRRIDWTLSSGAQVLIIALGGNDGLRGIDPKQTAANLAEIIKRARARVPGITIIVAGMQMPANLGADYQAAFNGLFARVAAEQKTELLPFLLEGVAIRPELNQADLIHPNVEGQKLVAETVWQALMGVLKSQKP